MIEISALSPEEARAFAERWLPAWTGNEPERLVAFYTEDAFYSDPAVPSGVEGRQQLIGYFGRLLAQNPNWVWSHSGSMPIADGFLNFWHASIPVGEGVVEADGVCTVQLRQGLIYRNQVFFDPTPLRRVR